MVAYSPSLFLFSLKSPVIFVLSANQHNHLNLALSLSIHFISFQLYQQFVLKISHLILTRPIFSFRLSQVLYWSAICPYHLICFSLYLIIPRLDWTIQNEKQKSCGHFPMHIFKGKLSRSLPRSISNTSVHNSFE